MYIVNTQKEHSCESCKKSIPTWHKALVLLSGNFSSRWPVRKYYHANCGIAIITAVGTELEKYVNENPHK